MHVSPCQSRPLGTVYTLYPEKDYHIEKNLIPQSSYVVGTTVKRREEINLAEFLI